MNGKTMNKTNVQNQLSDNDIINNRKNLVLGILCMILSATSFACMNIFVRLSGSLPTLQKTLFRNGIVMFISIFILIRNKHCLKLDKSLWIFLFLRSFFGLAGMTANYYAVDHLPIADASMLSKLSPFFAILFSYFLLHEKVGKVQVTAIFLAILGTLFVTHPWLEQSSATVQPVFLDYCVGLAGGAGAGIAYSFVRYLTLRNVDKNFIIFFFSATSTLILLPKVLLNYQPMSSRQTIFLLLAGIFAALGQYGITYAYSFAPAKHISIFDYTQVIVAAVLSAVILGDYPAFVSYIGYVIIFIASMILFLYNYKTAERA